MKHVPQFILFGIFAFHSASCGPKYPPPDAPSTACRVISEAAFNVAKQAGAASAKAKIRESGVASMSTGASVKHCSSFKGSKQVCRRPNDFVIHYILPDDNERYVMVPKGRDYRLNHNRKPIPCEVIDR